MGDVGTGPEFKEQKEQFNRTERVLENKFGYFASLVCPPLRHSPLATRRDTRTQRAPRVRVCGVGVPSKAYIISTRTLLPSRISLVGIPILTTVAYMYMLNLHSSTVASAAILKSTVWPQDLRH